MLKRYLPNQQKAAAPTPAPEPVTEPEPKGNAMNKILTTIAGPLLQMLLSQVTPDVVKRAADKALDVVEEAAADSSTKIDDVVVLPLCKTLRAAFDIADNDAA